MNPYQLPQLIAARNRVSNIRSQFQSGLGQAKTGGLVALGSYGAARMSAHLGGPGGAKIAGVDLPLAVGGACALISMSGWAGEYSDEVLAVGIGAVAGYAAQKGFDAGMKSHKPAAAVAGYEYPAAPPSTGYVGAGHYPHMVGAPLDGSPEDIIENFANTPSPVEDAA